MHTPPLFFCAAKVAIEAGRQFDECYGLAYAQQLKNKDIPEGGSKAVVLVDTTNSTVRHSSRHVFAFLVGRNGTV